jgi:hypothetical protein
MKKKFLLLSALSVSFSSGAIAAVFSGTFDFAGTTGNVASFAYNGTPIPNVTVGNLDKVGVTTSSSTGNSRASGWPTGATTGSDTFTGTINLGSYFEFTLTADTGYTIDMTSISFGIGRSATGPRQWEWRTSVDTFGSTVGTYTTINAGLTNSSGVLTNPDSNSSWTGNVLDLSGASYKDLSSITLRFYGYNSEAATGTGGLQGNLSFAGEAIPEPGAALLGSLGMLCLLRRRR